MPVVCSPIFPSESEDPVFQEFPYPLSDFQKHAIKAILEKQHVLVCAPTGSGKTLPAEFAIQHFIRQGKRVIYTSPIKALSNQKYHEFTKKFPDITVGLCTGDIKTNPTADLIIMTAEILNNRLFQVVDRASHAESQMPNFDMDIETELAAVIMDEVHYINDDARGHVWEQTILTLPPHIQMIMLSATLDRPEKFAEWIESTRPPEMDKRVYVSHTSVRIVPLSHYAFYPKAPESIVKATKATPLESVVKTHTGNLITLQQSNGRFDLASYNMIRQLNDVWVNGPPSRKHVLNSLATFMKGSDDPDIDDTMLPAIVFLFSRKQVEESARDLTANILSFDSKIPYNAARECEQIVRRLPNWREYVELPEYVALVRMLEKGVGIHHSGMIPVLREIVEMMISQKKIFMLFATESFAIGLDCPIRTAVFTSLAKWDGNSDRPLYAHEYTQMAGRAGRRGIDTVGHVVHLPLLFRRSVPPEVVYRSILSNTPQRIVSKFQIDYNMVLSLLKKGTTTDFHLFAERSMSTAEVAAEVAEAKRAVINTQWLLENKRKSSANSRTLVSACLDYIALDEQARRATNKKRKELERKLAFLRENNRYIVEDMSAIINIRRLESELVEKERTVVETESYLKTRTDLVCRILLERGIIAREEDATYRLKEPLGIISSNLRETHPIPLAEWILKTDWLSSWTAVQIVGLLSAYVDIRIPESNKSVEPNSDDARVLSGIVFLRDSHDELRRQELELAVSSSGRELCFDMADLMMEWCGLADEAGCKRFLGDIVASGISTGDFTKACMKISATGKELMAMCESFPGSSESIALMRKMADVDGLILKSVATTQSLYL